MPGSCRTSLLIYLFCLLIEMIFNSSTETPALPQWVGTEDTGQNPHHLGSDPLSFLSGAGLSGDRAPGVQEDRPEGIWPGQLLELLLT